MLPCCYKSKYVDIREDKYFKKAVELAENEALKNKYIFEADRIAKIWQEWENKAKNFDYDVFLSFKVTDNDVETEDCVLMREIYAYLTEKGYKVFYSPVTMREYVGQPYYDAYIFNALEKSEVLICCGLKAEYLSTTWVENEWTRYLALIQDCQKQCDSLIVVYGDYNPSLELPSQLACRQGISASSRTMFPDILSIVTNIKKDDDNRSVLQHVEIKKNKQGVKKAFDGATIELEDFGSSYVVRKDFTQSKEVNFKELPNVGSSAITPDINQKIQTANKLLKNNFFEDATSFYEDCLKEDSKNGMAILGLMACKMHDYQILVDVDPDTEFTARILSPYNCDVVREFDSKLNFAVEYVPNANVGERVLKFLTETVLASFASLRIFRQEYFETVFNLFRIINSYNTANKETARKIAVKLFETIYKACGPTFLEKFATEVIEGIPSGELTEYLSVIEKVINIYDENNNMAFAAKWNALKIEHYEGDVNSTIRSIYYSCNVQNKDDFIVHNIQNKCAYKITESLDDLVKKMSKENAFAIFDLLQEVEFECLKSTLNRNICLSNAKIYFNFITKYKYDGRNAFIQKTVEYLDYICKQNDYEFVLDIIDKMDLGQNPDAYIEALKNAGEKMLSYRNFQSADNIFNKIFTCQENNFIALRDLLFSRIKFNLEDYSNCNINLATDDEIRNVISYSTEKEEENRFLKTLILICFCELRKHPTSSLEFKKVSDKFDFLLKCLNVEEKEKTGYLNEAARICLSKNDYAKAEEYANISLQIDPKSNVDGRYIVLLSTLKCKNDIELVKCCNFNKNMPEFKNLLVACADNEEQLKKFLTLADDNRNNFENKSKKNSAIKKVSIKSSGKNSIIRHIFAICPFVLNIVFGTILFDRRIEIAFSGGSFGGLFFLWGMSMILSFVCLLFYYLNCSSVYEKKFNKAYPIISLVYCIITSLIVFPLDGLKEDFALSNYVDSTVTSVSVDTQFFTVIKVEYTVHNYSDADISYVSGTMNFFDNDKFLFSESASFYSTIWSHGTHIEEKSFYEYNDKGNDIKNKKYHLRAEYVITSVRLTGSLITYSV